MLFNIQNIYHSCDIGGGGGGAASFGGPRFWLFLEFLIFFLFFLEGRLGGRLWDELSSTSSVFWIGVCWRFGLFLLLTGGGGAGLFLLLTGGGEAASVVADWRPAVSCADAALDLCTGVDVNEMTRATALEGTESDFVCVRFRMKKNTRAAAPPSNSKTMNVPTTAPTTPSSWA